MEQFITKYWVQLLTLGGIIIWAVRVEGKVSISTKQIEHLNKRLDDQDKILRDNTGLIHEVARDVRAIKESMEWMKSIVKKDI